MTKEVTDMKKSSEDTRRCCAFEKKHLMRELRKCDLTATSYEDAHRCHQKAAKESGRRSRLCIAA